MKGVNFPESNTLLARPEGMTEEECYDLSVCRTIMENGTPVVISCWELTPDEIATIIGTKKIWLWIIGKTHPPVILDVKYPWDTNQKPASQETSDHMKDRPTDTDFGGSVDLT